MSWYRRSKLGFETISRYFTSKTNGPNTTFQNRASVINHKNQLSKFPSYTNYLARVPRPVNSVNRSLGFGAFGSCYRHYHVTHVRHPKRFKWWPLSNKHKAVLAVMLVGSGFGLTIYLGEIETIPYTKRKHIVLLSQHQEKRIGESKFKNMQDKTYKGKILPAKHPDNVRVLKISENIIQALKRGLKKEQISMNLNNVLAEKDELIQDDMRSVDQSRKKGKDKEETSINAHLLGLKWEVLVVNDHLVNAFCLPGGKIVVFTGLLEHFRTDEEIATVIGHEVAHAVARHTAEHITKKLWFLITQLILFQYFEIRDAIAISDLLLELPFSRRMESEAYYIGLMLMASAGYDPRLAPKVYEKLSKVGPQIPSFLHYLTTHPSGENRSKALSKAWVMQEALSYYRETKKGRKVDDFFL